MGRSTGEIYLEGIAIEDVRQFYRWLTGEGVEDISTASQPMLTEEEAWAVIYYLQEKLEILPDKFERCRACGGIYDSENEGVSVNRVTTVPDGKGNLVPGDFPENMWGCYCDECRPDAVVYESESDRIVRMLERKYSSVVCLNSESCDYPERIGCCYDKAVRDCIETINSIHRKDK